MSIDLLM